MNIFAPDMSRKLIYLANCTQNTSLKTDLFEILIPNFDQHFFSEVKLKRKTVFQSICHEI